MQTIKISKTTTPKPKPEGPLGFGKYFTDHMFTMKYSIEEGWHEPSIIPFQNLSLSPATKVLHYGQEMFEGLKAYGSASGKTYLFRPEKNGERTNETNQRLCIPELPVEDFVEAIRTLVKIDIDWVPNAPGTSLYIRPFIIATDDDLIPNPSLTYLFIIILSPSGAYMKDGITPVGIWVEGTYVRAVKGGMGFAKSGGNYASSMLAQRNAVADGYAQVLWLDGVKRKYIEEVGAMNIFFKIGNKIITPMLTGSILAGITRDSVITLCRSWGIEVEERLISIDELIAAYESGELEEAFGTGTAAVITPIGKLGYKDRVMNIADDKPGPFSKKLYDTITGIQRGELEDNFGWRVEV